MSHFFLSDLQTIEQFWFFIIRQPHPYHKENSENLKQNFYPFMLLERWLERNKNKIIVLKDVWMSTSKFAKHAKMNLTLAIYFYS